jgi:hypothetical protein
MRRPVRTILVLTLGALAAASALPCPAEDGAPAEAAPHSAVLQDWILQDAGRGAGECFTSATGAALEAEMVGRALEELGPDAKPYRDALDRLSKGAVPGGDKRWQDLYVAACERRRKVRLQRLIEKYPRIVFTKHYNLGGSHYAYTEGQSDAQAERHFRPGSALCLLETGAAGPRARTLIDDPRGVIRDPDVSYEGKRIVFAWKRSSREDDYHLYELNAETGDVRQLTFGLGFADYEPAYLPNGDIVFNSTRCVQIVDCWWTEVSNLYTCDAGGRYLRRLTFDQVHTNYPQVLGDGRVIYTRWDYNDRGQIFPQPLFQMNADGTGQTEFYGNNSWFPTTIMHAREIPGTQKVIGVISGHHCIQKGKLAIVDPSRGTQENTGVQLIAPVRRTKAERIDSYGQDGDQFQYPYPVTETQFVVAYLPDDDGKREGGLFGLYLMDVDGRRELLACDPKASCNQPVPLAARPLPHLRPSLVDYRKDTGTYYVKDVYAGPGLKGIERGTVKGLRVVALEFRAAGIGENGSTGPGGAALSSTPPSVDNAAWDVKRVLGTTPVYADGSAMFTVPARTPVYFQLLDAKNHVVQSMRSWSTLQPGETFSCVGCHEGKNQASPPKGGVTMALRQGARTLEPFYGPPTGFSFPKQIQPIFDKHCVRCHDDREAAAKMQRRPSRTRAAAEPPTRAQPTAEATTDSVKRAFSLLDARTVDDRAKRAWSDAYLVLTRNGSPNRIVNWLNVQSIPPMLPPYFAGAAKSELVAILEKGHYGVRLNREEMDKIACWIDLLVPFCGDYTEAGAWDEAERNRYAHFLTKRERMAAIERRNIRDLLATRAAPGAAPRADEEAPAYRNVALNPADVQGPPAGYPHATSNSEFGNMPCFAAACAIDGKTDNKGHGDAYPSWGPDKRKDPWWKVEFGRAVEIDKVVLHIRADFPHDAYWRTAAIEFSDGTRERIQIQKTADPQTFSFRSRTVTSLKFTDLVQDEPLGWCGFTEVEVWGRNAATVMKVAPLAGGARQEEPADPH